VDEFATPGEEVEFVLSISDGGGYATVDTFSVVLGPIPILLVDDDAGESTEEWFQESLDRLGYLCQTWCEDTAGEPPLSELDRYAVVVWTCGWGGKLGSVDRGILGSYLDGGGKIFISGEDIGWALNYEGDTDKIQFYNDYLHADYIADDSGYRSVDGVSGDPIGDGLSLTLNGTDSAMNQFYPSEIEPRSGATGIFEYDPGVEGALRYETGHRQVYLAFGFEGVSGESSRDAIMSRVLDWLSMGLWPDTTPPTITLVDPNGGEQLAVFETIEISWVADDDVGVQTIDLYYSGDGGGSYPDTIATGLSPVGSYLWTVPGTENPTSRIRAVARDAAGLASYDDSDGDFEIIDPGSGVDDAGYTFGLRQNVPNPFNPYTRIAYSVPARSDVRLTIYDVNGRLVTSLVEGAVAAGDHIATWDGKSDSGEDLSSGIYFYRLTADGRELARRMILLR
jgi:hypothetical protein